MPGLQLMKSARNRERGAVATGTHQSTCKNGAPFHKSIRFRSLLLRVHYTAFLIAALFFCVSAQQRRLFTPADILRVATVSDAQISPNGRWVVYTVSNADGDKTVNTLFIERTGTSSLCADPPQPTARTMPPNIEWPELRTAPSLLLPAGWSASTPRWSPDGNSIAFLASRDEQDGLWTVRLDRKEPKYIAGIQSTNFFITYAGEQFSWSAHSKRIAYITATPETVESSSTSDDPRVIDRIQYKSRTSFSDNRRTRLGCRCRTGEPRQLTSGLFYDHAVAFSQGDELLTCPTMKRIGRTNNSDISQ
jgi:hypothetical protein